MISSLFVEAAIRSIFLALAVWIGLRAFKVRNVLAQKVAWGLVLASAVVMPVVLPMTEHWSVLPANVRVVIPADPETLLEELQARIQAKTPATARSSADAIDDVGTTSPSESSADNRQPLSEAKLAAQTPASFVANDNAEESGVDGAATDRFPAPTVTQSAISVTETQQPATIPVWRKLSLLQILGLGYLAVAGVLCVRLLYGLLMAVDVWRSAKPATLARSPLTDGLRLRVSDSISSPVTVGSAVVLPCDFCQWDSEKLRIVLAHERSHIRQGDFYLQLLAGFYSAVVWFSPLGWWLKRTLSDLAEAISDRAGLEEAVDRTSYAQVLLEFAAAPRPTTIGVAMARHGSLSRRIERLLNDVSFRQAFAGTRRGLVAVVVVPIALFIATALVRVEAATGQESQVQAQAVLPSTGVVVPQEPVPSTEPQESESKPEQAETPAPAVAPQAASSGVTPKAAECDCADQVLTIPSPGHAPVAPAGVPAAPAHVPAVPGVAPVPPAHAPSVLILHGQPTIATLALSPKLWMKTPMIVVPHVAYAPNTTLAIIAPSHVSFGEGYGHGVGQSTSSGTMSYSSNGKHSGYHWYSSDGESYAVIRGGDTEHMSFSGNWMQGQREEIEKARKQAGGKDILWFTHEGKSYVVDDPATLAQIEAMYGPIDELGRQQEALGKKQEALGKQQEDLGKQQEGASVATPDMSKEIAKMEEAMAKLKASQGKNMTQEQFSDLQERLGELQSRIGEIQGEIGEKQGEFGARMGELGQRMGELGAEQGELGAKQGKLAEQADQRVKSIIDESLKNGKARPVQ
jgi:beta-lactamase regulating signal transducer with metallopeptidase domain